MQQVRLRAVRVGTVQGLMAGVPGVTNTVGSCGKEGRAERLGAAGGVSGACLGSAQGLMAEAPGVTNVVGACGMEGRAERLNALLEGFDIFTWGLCRG